MIYLDGPGGTQVPNQVLESMNNYYSQSNTNTHGAFLTSQETDAVIDKVREDVSTLLGAEGPHTISLGQNMTTLNYSLARGIGRVLQEGDEILITQLDHEGNRGPWLSLRELGIEVLEVKLLEDGTLDYQDLEEKVNDRTRIIAVGMASNALGTVNDIPRIRKIAYDVGAWLVLDAVHYAPHFSVDVQQLGCDFLLCSAYKFYGPHIGMLYSRPGLLDRIPTDRLRTADQSAPYCIETGTLNHAALAGVSSSIEFIGSLSNGNKLRDRLAEAYQLIGKHERKLATKLYSGLKEIKGIELIGQNFENPHRAPTLSFTAEGLTPWEVCEHLSKYNICAWDGHFYAIRAIEVLGLLERGGVTRMGFSMYNEEQEVDTVLDVINGFMGGKK